MYYSNQFFVGEAKFFSGGGGVPPETLCGLYVVWLVMLLLCASNNISLVVHKKGF